LFAEKDVRALELWEVETQRKLATLDNSWGSYGTLSLRPLLHRPIWSHDGRLVVTTGPGMVKTGPGMAVGTDGLAILKGWEVVYPTPTYAARRHVTSLTFSPDGKQLTVNGSVWDMTKLQGQTFLRPAPQQADTDYLLYTANGQIWGGKLPADPS